MAHIFSSKKFSVITSIVSKRSVNNVAYINYFSLLFSNLIPIGPTADICRIYVLKSNYDFPIIKCLIVVLIDRVSSLIVISILGVIFLLLTSSFIAYSLKFYFLFFFWTLILIILSLIIVKFSKISLFVNKIFNFNIMKFSEVKNLSIDLKVIFLTILHTFFIFLAFVACGSSVIGISLEIIIISPLLQVIHSVPFFFSGWGIREVTLIFFLNELNIMMTTEKILLISILIGFSIFLSAIPSLIFLNKVTKNIFNINSKKVLKSE